VERENSTEKKKADTNH